MRPADRSARAARPARSPPLAGPAASGPGVRAESGAARPEGEGGGSDARGSDVPGIGPEATARALARDVGANDRGAVADGGDLAPAESVRIVAIFERDVMRGGRRDPGHEDTAEAERRQPGLPGGQREARRAQRRAGRRSRRRGERSPARSSSQVGPAVRGGLARREGPVAVAVDPSALLERGDLRHVHRVVDDDLVGPHDQRGGGVDREVARAGARERAPAPTGRRGPGGRRPGPAVDRSLRLPSPVRDPPSRSRRGFAAERLAGSLRRS